MLFIPDIAHYRSTGHGAPGVSNTAGAALWTLDYTLFAASIRISQVFFHEGIGFKYNLIQPATLTRSIIDGNPLSEPIPPHVQPQYYGTITAAIVRRYDVENILWFRCRYRSGSYWNLWPVHHHRDDHQRPLHFRVRCLLSRISSPAHIGRPLRFTVYEGNTLKRAVLINSKAWLASDEGARDRTVTNVAFSGVSGMMSVKRLAIGHADDTAGLTWGGVSYETASGLPDGKVGLPSVSVGDGVDIKGLFVMHFVIEMMGLWFEVNRN